MENINTKEGYFFKMLGDKTLAVQDGIEGIWYCPFCYNQTAETAAKCQVCNKRFPELIYYHSDDDTWIASGNEN